MLLMASLNENPGEHIPELTLGRRLMLARVDAELTQAELAQRIDVSKRSVVNYESDSTTPRRHVLLSWALATGVPLAWLETGDETTPGIHVCQSSVQLDLFELAA